MNQNQRHQSIMCGVRSCNHYKNGGCLLEAITVAPCIDCITQKKEDQSMCSNYSCCE